MMHPDDSLLLAYLRQQQRRDWPEGIQQHIGQCTLCSIRCAELMHAGTTLETWARSNAYRSYPSITNSVLQQIHCPKPSFAHRLKREILPASMRLVSLPVAVLLVILCTASVLVLAAHQLSGTSAHPSVVKRTQTTVVTTAITPQPTSTPIKEPTAVTSSATGSTTVTEKAYITDCTTSRDHTQQHLHICGGNFTPGSAVVLILNTSNGRPFKHPGPVQVSSDGTIQVSISIHSCKDVPATVHAGDVSVPTETAAVENIDYGYCSLLGIP